MLAIVSSVKYLRRVKSLVVSVETWQHLILRLRKRKNPF